MLSSTVFIAKLLLTILVSLTKPDLVDDGGEHHVIDLVKGKRNKLKLGYCIVRNRSQKELDTNSVSRGDKEREFFNTDPWSSLPKDRVGVHALKSRLRDLLTEIVKREFPKIKSQIEHRLADCKKRLAGMGAERETPEQQRRYLEGIAAQFETMAKDALSTSYFRHDLFQREQNLRLPTLVVDRSDRFAEDIRRRGHTVKFREDEDVKQDNAECEPSPDDGYLDDESFLGEKTVDARVGSDFANYPELLDILRLDVNMSPTNHKDIKAWIRDEYRKARGYSLEVMDPNILPMLWQEQSRNWEGITIAFVNDVIIYVHDFICRLLHHVCPDARVRSGLLSFIMDGLLTKYKNAIDHVEFVLRVERHGTLLTKNHYFGDTLGKLRNERLLAAVKNSEFTSTTSANGRSLQSFQVIRVDNLVDIASKSNFEHAVEDMHAILQAYYKVAMKRFIDTVVAQGTDYFLLTGENSPIKILTPLFISSMTAEQLEEIAGEDLISKRERQELNEEIQALEQGRKLLRG